MAIEGRVPLPTDAGPWWYQILPTDEWRVMKVSDADVALLLTTGEHPIIKRGSWLKAAALTGPETALLNLRGTLRRCLDAHLAAAREYEKGRNTRGAAQLRAVANMLGVILQGKTPCTVLPCSSTKKE